MTDTHRMLPQSWRGWAALAAGTAMLAALPFVATPYYVGLLTTAMIGAMLALAVHLLVGATGLVSLGHGAFYGLAAYVVYLVSPEGTGFRYPPLFDSARRGEPHPFPGPCRFRSPKSTDGRNRE